MFKRFAKAAIFLCCILLALPISFELDAKRVKVRGYYRKDGTYVKPHTRKAPSRKQVRSSTRSSKNRVSKSRVYVRGYYRKDGTYVKHHYRTAPDGIPYNNYSYPGNYNPNTGKITTGDPQKYLDRYYNRHRLKSRKYLNRKVPSNSSSLFPKIKRKKMSSNRVPLRRKSEIRLGMKALVSTTKATTDPFSILDKPRELDNKSNRKTDK